MFVFAIEVPVALLSSCELGSVFVKIETSCDESLIERYYSKKTVHIFARFSGRVITSSTLICRLSGPERPLSRDVKSGLTQH